MGDLPSERPGAPSPRIVDLVFAGEPAGDRRLALGIVIALLVHAGVLATLLRLGAPAGPSSAALAARVHDAVRLERIVDLQPPPLPPPLPAPVAESPRMPSPRAGRTVPAARARPRPLAPPARAGQLAALSTAPVDFTASAFVVGSAASFGGGATTAGGTGRAPAPLTAARDGTGEGSLAGRGAARPVSLDQSAWSCPWPVEADAQQVNEQTVVLRVAVRTDGRAEHVDVLSDPGFGFGAAARLCALRTRFEPARDGAGRAIATLSPAIRVHFLR